MAGMGKAGATHEVTRTRQREGGSVMKTGRVGRRRNRANRAHANIRACRGRGFFNYPVTASGVCECESTRVHAQLAAPGCPGKIDNTKPAAICRRAQKGGFRGVFRFKILHR